MSALTTLRNLLRRHPEAEPAEAEQDRDTAAAEVAAAEAAVAAAEAAYTAGLLEANPADMRALDDNRRAAAIRVDQARAFLAALETRLAEAQDREAERGKAERYAAARAQADAAADTLRDMYPQLAVALVDVLRSVAEAEVAVKAANADLPRGAAPLLPVESRVRDLPGRPEEIVSEAEVTRFCRKGVQMPGGLDQSAVSRVNGGHWFIQHTNAQNEYVAERAFIEQSYLPKDPGKSADGLAARLNLPGLRAGDAPFWKPPGDTVRPEKVLLLIMEHEADRKFGDAALPEGKLETRLRPVDPLTPEQLRAEANEPRNASEALSDRIAAAFRR